MRSKLKYFEALGIPPTTDLNEIKKAYRRKAMRYHPDRNPSRNAQEKFIQISEAYDYLINPNKVDETTIKVRNAEEVKAAKIRKAKARYKKMQRDEKNKDAAYFTKITTGQRWKLFRFLAIYTCCLSIALSIDFFGTRKGHTTAELTTYSHIPNAVLYENEVFIITHPTFWTHEFTPVQKNYSFLFNDLKSIDIANESFDLSINNVPSDRNKKFDLFKRYSTTRFYAYSSVYYLFPFLHLLLFIPLLLVIFKRPNFRFALWRLVSIWIIYPLTVYLTFSNGRIFYLFIWW